MVVPPELQAKLRVNAAEALITVAFKILLGKGVVSAAELGGLFDDMSGWLQRNALRATDLTDADQFETDVSLAMIGRVRGFLEV